MTRKEFANKNSYARIELLKQEPKTQIEKDIWNLKYMMYGIEKDSNYYNFGCIKSLKNAIKLLEKQKE